MNVESNQVALNIISGSLTCLKLNRIYKNMIRVFVTFLVRNISSI